MVDIARLHILDQVLQCRIQVVIQHIFPDNLHMNRPALRTIARCRLYKCITGMLILTNHKFNVIVILQNLDGLVL